MMGDFDTSAWKRHRKTPKRFDPLVGNFDTAAATPVQGGVTPHGVTRTNRSSIRSIVCSGKMEGVNHRRRSSNCLMTLCRLNFNFVKLLEVGVVHVGFCNFKNIWCKLWWISFFYWIVQRNFTEWNQTNLLGVFKVFANDWLFFFIKLVSFQICKALIVIVY